MSLLKMLYGVSKIPLEAINKTKLLSSRVLVLLAYLYMGPVDAIANSCTAFFP